MTPQARISYLLTFPLFFAHLSKPAPVPQSLQPAPGNRSSCTGCVPEGECCTVTSDRPPLPPPPSSQPPSGSEGGTHYTDDPPMMYEDDTIADDEMGETSTTGTGGGSTTTTSSGQVCNDDGDLSGPNDEDQNGLGEGDCIEVKIGWTVYAWDPTWEVWGEYYICYPPIELCPC